MWVIIPLPAEDLAQNLGEIVLVALFLRHVYIELGFFLLFPKQRSFICNRGHREDFFLEPHAAVPRRDQKD